METNTWASLCHWSEHRGRIKLKFKTLHFLLFFFFHSFIGLDISLAGTDSENWAKCYLKQCICNTFFWLLSTFFFFLRLSGAGQAGGSTVPFSICKHVLASFVFLDSLVSALTIGIKALVLTISESCIWVLLVQLYRY